VRVELHAGEDDVKLRLPQPCQPARRMDPGPDSFRGPALARAPISASNLCLNPTMSPRLVPRGRPCTFLGTEPRLFVMGQALADVQPL
jgi:hypothetical protein